MKNKPVAPNARFWTFENNAWVKLTLRCGQVLTWGEFAKTDEGWASKSCTWEHTGYGVRRSWRTDGRDCDGRVESAGDDFAALDLLEVVPVFVEIDAQPCHETHEGRAILRPDWAPVGLQRNRDHAAELANY